VSGGPLGSADADARRRWYRPGAGRLVGVDVSGATGGEFGRALRRLRDERGLSQPQLAKLVPISQSALSRYENGKQTADPSMRARLDDVLDARGELLAVRDTPPLSVFTTDGVDRDRLVHVAGRPRSVDHATVDTLAVTLSQWRRLDDSLGASVVLSPVMATLGRWARSSGKHVAMFGQRCSMWGRSGSSSAVG
jgi:transcriptional regulator with XRE-family HTH domain